MGKTYLGKLLKNKDFRRKFEEEYKSLVASLKKPKKFNCVATEK